MRFLVLALGLAVAATGCSDELGPIAERAQPIIDGDATHDYPAVGELLIVGPRGGVCTGTLIGCSTVLTAGHCVCIVKDEEMPDVCDLVTPEQVRFFLQHRGIFRASDVLLHPDYGRPDDKLTADVAVIKLEQPVFGIAPMGIVDTAPSPGTQMTLVGYGRTDSLNGYEVGVKRLGRSPVSSCTSPESDAVHQCREIGDKTCQGDSGGPALQGTGPTALIAGITSYGYRSPGFPEDQLTDCKGRKVSAQVATYADWIEDQAGIDLSTDACGTAPAVGEGALSEQMVVSMVEGDQVEMTLEVPKGTSELHLTWNGYQVYMDGANQAGITTFLSLTEGFLEGQEEAINSACNAEGRTCRARSPNSGTWRARFRLESGSGDYQLTMTAYGDAPISEPDSYEIAEDSFIQTGAEDGVLGNDTGSSRGGSAVLVDRPLNGQLALRGGGSFDYQPESDFVGTDSFSYRYDDGEYTSEETLVTLEVIDEAGCGCRTGAPRGGLWLIVVIGLMAIRRRRRPCRRRP
ncbi:MAG: trypsin-like serine protease [Deltaproteobacteria bacterium]|nr:trypsin-like serine protease [Deltaproteobacteria bacterium]